MHPEPWSPSETHMFSFFWVPCGVSFFGFSVTVGILKCPHLQDWVEGISLMVSLIKCTVVNWFAFVGGAHSLVALDFPGYDCTSWWSTGCFFFVVQLCISSAMYLLEHTNSLLFGEDGWSYFVYLCHSKKLVKFQGLILTVTRPGSC